MLAFSVINLINRSLGILSSAFHMPCSIFVYLWYNIRYYLLMLVTNSYFSYTFIEIIQICDNCTRLLYNHCIYIHVKQKSLVNCFYFIQDFLLVYHDYHVHYIKLLSFTNVINTYFYVIKYLYNQEYFYVIEVLIYLRIICLTIILIYTIV